MKLYTEEQVRKAMSALNDIKYMYHSDDDIFESLTPIELPSDEEIVEQAVILLHKKYPYHPPSDGGYWKDMFIEGANLVINHIKQQDNGE